MKVSVTEADCFRKIRGYKDWTVFMILFMRSLSIFWVYFYRVLRS